MKNGTSGAVTKRISPDTQSMGKMTTKNKIGSIPDLKSCGRYLAK